MSTSKNSNSNTNANSNSFRCPISLVNTRNINSNKRFKECLGETIYDADALARWIFQHEKTTYPCTKKLVTLEDLVRLYDMAQIYKPHQFNAALERFVLEAQKIGAKLVKKYDNAVIEFLLTDQSDDNKLNQKLARSLLLAFRGQKPRSPDRLDMGNETFPQKIKNVHIISIFYVYNPRNTPLQNTFFNMLIVEKYSLYKYWEGFRQDTYDIGICLHTLDDDNKIKESYVIWGLIYGGGVIIRYQKVDEKSQAHYQKLGLQFPFVENKTIITSAYQAPTINIIASYSPNNTSKIYPYYIPTSYA